MSDLDLVIRGGIVVDGTGAEGYTADVGIAGGKIAEIGKIAAGSARVIDAEGHIVTPGFIDGHTHMDAQMHWDHLGTNSVWHGVSTVVMGNCGFSIAPMRKGKQALVARSLERAEDISGAAMAAGIDFSWENYDQYLDVVDALPKGINHAAYVGHSALRTFVMGERAFEEEANADDLAAMTAELARGLDAGAMGFSTSRSLAHLTSDDRPVASRLASRDEVAALVGSMKGRKGAVFELAHEILLPGNLEGDTYWNWLRDLTISSGVATTYGVLGRFAATQIDYIDGVTAAGGRMFGQTHSRGVSSLFSFRSAFLFDKQGAWQAFRQQPLELQKAQLADPAVRAALIDAVDHAQYGTISGAEGKPPEWDAFYYFDNPMPPYRTLAQLAAERGASHPLDVLFDLAIETDMHALFMQYLTSASDEEAVRVMRHPSSIMTFSDSGAHVSQIADGSIQTHLLAYFCRDKQLLSIPEAVEMMTSRAAKAWGFADRGVLASGMAADVNVFDPATVGPEMPEVVHDLPTGARRFSQRAKGFRATVVNGQVLTQNGVHTGALPGQLLRRRD
jgi:N-acyl-D-aspartate/D-glutamate deacylase